MCRAPSAPTHILPMCEQFCSPSSTAPTPPPPLSSQVRTISSVNTAPLLHPFLHSHYCLWFFFFLFLFICVSVCLLVAVLLSLFYLFFHMHNFFNFFVELFCCCCCFASSKSYRLDNRVSLFMLTLYLCVSLLNVYVLMHKN